MNPRNFQDKVTDWLHRCFGGVIAEDQHERNFRFLEEALELVQTCGMSREDAKGLVDYVYGRPAGEKQQEVGGVMVTLAALCFAQGIDLGIAADSELKRIQGKIEEIRRKKLGKPHRAVPENGAVGSQPASPAGKQKP